MSKPRRAAAGDVAIVSQPCAPKRAAALEAQPARSWSWRKAIAPVVAMGSLSLVVGIGIALPNTQEVSYTATSQSNVALSRPAQGFSQSRSVERPALVSVTPAPTQAAAPSVTPAATPSAATKPAATQTPKAKEKPKPAYPALGKVTSTKYSSADGVNVREFPTTSSKAVTKFSRGTKVSATNVTYGSWQQVRYNGKSAWVSKKLLAAKKPASTGVADVNTPATGGFSSAKCRYGSSIESGITRNTKRVFRAFCATFPTITSYGGYRRAESWSYHSRGAAIDAMVYNRTHGWKMAKWVAANARALNVDQVIYAQHLWTKRTPRWRLMSDRGSITANHYDHVHISVG